MSKPVLLLLPVLLYEKRYAVLLTSQSRVKAGRTVLRHKWILIEKVTETYLFSRSLTQNFIRRPTMVANIFEDFEPP